MNKEMATSSSPVVQTEQVSQLFMCVKEDDFLKFKKLLEDGVDPNCIDESNTTILQEASFKGKLEFCRILLDYGADPNVTRHNHRYTALMFAVMSGNYKICLLLLRYGANPHAVNSISRNAVQLAAFTGLIFFLFITLIVFRFFLGQTRCVCVINNFIRFKQLEIYTKSTEQYPPRVTVKVANQVYDLLIGLHFHPVYVILYFNDNSGLLLPSARKNILFILEDLMERQMKGKNVNELMAFKINIIFRTVQFLYNVLSRNEQFEGKFNEKNSSLFEQGGNGKCDQLSEEGTKKILKIAKIFLDISIFAKEKLPYGDTFIRNAVLKFPFKNTAIWGQFVNHFKEHELKAGDAYDLLCGAILSERILTEESFCAACAVWDKQLLLCSSCKKEKYCSVRCQRLHWPIHKTTCTRRSQTSENQNNSDEQH
ncbi:Ankyrin repeat and MYND domain-containing protein 2 [Trichinella pseudospiralis]|uniref:Ankyrin repeat and MYND domain-containing protein 2 n=2 Tax=Trichinella pseudospiralis TaxID=6337 RepID=A0A0V1INB0_TRIPS|nr:Ankyrin repeat and MYND domain-containing protein 2 [Trichinella pseudospiralis]